MSKSITRSVYVGLDVHKDSIDIALAEAGRATRRLSRLRVRSHISPHRTQASRREPLAAHREKIRRQ